MNKLTHNKQSDRGVDRELQELTSAINTLIDKVADPGTSAPTDLDKANVQVITTGNNEYCLAVRTTDGFVTSAPGILEKVDTLSQTYRSNLSSYKKISASVAEYDSEIGVDKLVVQQVVTGAQVTCKSGAKLAQGCILPKAGEGIDIYVEEIENYSGHLFADGDIVCIRKLIRTSNTVVTNSSAWGVVTYIERIVPEAYPSTPQQKYRFVRSILPNSGSATGPMPKGTSVMDYGTTGNGSIELTAIDGINGRNSPHVSVYSWTAHPLSGNLEKVRMGNLQGIVSPTWGALSGYGFWAKDDIYLEGDCYIKGDLTFTNQGSISISGFSNDAGYITSASAGNHTYYQATAPTANEGDFWFDTDDYAMFRKGVSTWSRISVYMDANGLYAGTITAGQITAGTLTGFTIQTAGSNRRTVITANENSIEFYDNADAIGAKLTGSGGVLELGWGQTFRVNQIVSAGIVNTQYVGVGYIENKEVKITATPYVHGIRFNSTNLEFGNGTDYIDYDVNLYRSAANVLRTDDAFSANAFQINGTALTYSDVGAAASGHNHSGVYAPAANGAAFGAYEASSRYVAISSGGTVNNQLYYVPLTINSVTWNVLVQNLTP